MCSGAGEIDAVMLGKEDIAGWLLSTPAKSRIKAKQAKTSWQLLAYIIT